MTKRAEYRRLLTQAYDIDKPEAPPKELAFYRSFIDRSAGPVLEAMCGSGRFLVPLREAGIDIDGFDASADMLRACEERCAARGVSADVRLQAIEELSMPRRYGFAFCGGGSFGLVTDLDDVAVALRKLHDALLPGGVLVIEVETPGKGARPGLWGGRWWERPDGALIVMRTVGAGIRDGVESALGIYELFVDGVLTETEVNSWVRRFWTMSEIETALAAADFEIQRMTRAFESTPASDDDPVISVIATVPDAPGGQGS
jgi:SAM-dependent methyltransferase